jgi:hypothetical protein
MIDVSQGLRRAQHVEGPDHPPLPPRLRRFGGDRTGLVALASLLLVVAAVLTLHVRKYDQLSPIDELHHVDYLVKAAHGQLLRRGDLIGAETRREGACRGVDAPGLPPPDCGDESWLAGREFNSEEIQPPAYYFLSGWTARLLRPVLGIPSLVTAGRMVGVLWLSAAVLVLWGAMAMLGVPILVRWAVGALIATTPVVLHASATITDDAAGLFAGGAVLLAALAWEKRRVPGVVVLAATVVAVSLRLTNMVGAGAVVLYLVLRAFSSPGEDDATVAPVAPSRRTRLLMAGGATAAVLLTGVAWVTLNSAVARVGPLANPNTFNQHVTSLSRDAVLGQLGAAVTPVRDPPLVPFLRNDVVRTLVTLTDWLLLGGAIGLAVLSTRGSRAEALGVSAIVCVAATGPVLTITNYVFQGSYFGIPARYGISLLPVLGVSLALSLQKRWTQVALASLAGASVLVTLVAELR